MALFWDSAADLQSADRASCRKPADRLESPQNAEVVHIEGVSYRAEEAAEQSVKRSANRRKARK